MLLETVKRTTETVQSMPPLELTDLASLEASIVCKLRGD